MSMGGFYWSQAISLVSTHGVNRVRTECMLYRCMQWFVLFVHHRHWFVCKDEARLVGVRAWCVKCVLVLLLLLLLASVHID